MKSDLMPDAAALLVAAAKNRIAIQMDGDEVAMDGPHLIIYTLAHTQTHHVEHSQHPPHRTQSHGLKVHRFSLLFPLTVAPSNARANHGRKTL